MVQPEIKENVSNSTEFFEPASLPSVDLKGGSIGFLEFQDGSIYEGISFGSTEVKCVPGECVFQTGMVGYNESLTDPSYRGQILVLTYPLVGNYGVPSRDDLIRELNNLPRYFESNKIHVAGLIVAKYEPGDFSHFLAASSLSDWLTEHKVPALYGLDTRALTKKIRQKGVMLGKIRFPSAELISGKSISEMMKLDMKSLLNSCPDLPYADPNSRHLVSEVSIQKPMLYSPYGCSPAQSNGKTIRILAIDVGMKLNQIRCFTNRGVELQVAPWNYDFTSSNVKYDGLFISNGPGDPTMCSEVVDRLKILLQRASVPIFGICLGHQLLALAAGAKTKKMKFGNRGHNIPCSDLTTGRCYISSQNHGYAVDADSLPSTWREWFVNANDGSNEGIMHRELPYFSVQFHPESTPGPRDTEFLFEKFIQSVKACADAGKLVQLPAPEDSEICKPQKVNVRKVLILGSGGLSIGQAGEFDYSGSQAIKALKEEGIYTVLINPNIATIQTSKGLADKVYFLPVTPEFVRKVIQYEKPDGIFVSFGGQTALNCGVQMKDEFESLGVKVLGTPIETVIMTEDREIFAEKMLEINEKCAQSCSATTVKEALAAAKEIGYPIIARAAYALGGMGSGFASDEAELTKLLSKAFAYSPQVLIERSMKGWKEVEYEVVRDIDDNCITVCNMENFDPLGIHTGDSIVVAPSQTLSDEDYQMLRTTAVNVIRHLGVVGECNIQYALNPDSKEYRIIEVNARLSRSSALASKATGYPLAFVAAKLGLGIPLSQLKNSVTKATSACFEPSLDYVVVKIPRWDLGKFNRVSTKIGSAMKSVGEVMAIGRNFEETIQKAIRCIDYRFDGFSKNNYVEDIETELLNPSDKRLFAIANALHDDKFKVEEIWKMTKIDRWFLNKLRNIVQLDKKIQNFNAHDIPPIILKQSKQLGFSDRHLAKLLKTSEMAIRKIRQDIGINPFVKQIDTVAAESPCYTNYLYMTYNASESDVTFDENGVMVLGSGVYRIGSSVEFDWCAVRTVRTLRENSQKTIMVNYNPETVSTDYDEADRLYFENITLETVLDIYEKEMSAGVIVSMGGQTPNNIALSLHRQNVKIFGTSPEQIDGAENRYKFSRMCDNIGVDQPRWKELTSLDEARSFCEKVGFPVLVRPSYVLSGAAMNVVSSSEDLENYLLQAVAVSSDYPVVISKFIEEAKEIEMDAVAKDGKLIYHVISEHVENAGVHSGDATLVLPPQDLDPVTVEKIETATKKIGNALNVTGPFNIQFIAKNNEIKVIECNVRASRSFPFASKVIGVDLIELSTKAMMDIEISKLALARHSVVGDKQYVCVKVPQFSFSRLGGADPVLGVEMASTGEVACFGRDKYEAYLKSLTATGFVIPRKNILISIGSYKEKMEFLPSVFKLHELGFSLFATPGTADFLSEHGIPVKSLDTFNDLSPLDSNKVEYDLQKHLEKNLIDLYINLPSKNRYRRPASYMSDGYKSRRLAVDMSIPLITNVKCAKVLVEALCRRKEYQVLRIDSQTSHKVVTLPGLINVGMFVPSSPMIEPKDIKNFTKVALAGGFTTNIVLSYGRREAPDNFDFSSHLTQLRRDFNASGDVIFSMDPARTEVPVNSVVFFRFDDKKNQSDISVLSKLMKSWPTSVRIIAQASGTYLASVLFMANMLNRPVHISGVYRKQDIELISLSKSNGMLVTCDVPVHNLFLTASEFAGTKASLGNEDDVIALWKNMDSIDCFSTNEVSSGLYNDEKYYVGMKEALPLLLTAVNQGRLSMDDLEARLHRNPKDIFELPDIPDTRIEIELDRLFNEFSYVSLLRTRKLFGQVSRVVFRGKPAYIDGKFADENDDLVGDISPDDRIQKGRELKLLPRSTKSPTKHAENPRKLSSAPVVGGSVGTLASINTATVSAKPGKTSMAEIESVESSPVGKSFKQKLEELENLPAHKQEKIEKKVLLRDALIDKVEQIERSLNVSDGTVGDSTLPIQGQPQKQTDQSVMELSLNSKKQQEMNSRHIRSSFFRQNILNVSQFTRVELHVLFNAAQEMRTIVERHGRADILASKVLANLFYEPSTRTSASFEAAMVRLGGQVINCQPAVSSVKKGESLPDTVRTLGSYCDAVVLRHPDAGSSNLAAKYSKVPVINAGDGIGEHPTQAFLDVYTIREELGTVNGLNITIIGDLKNGRTVHSLIKVLAMYDVKINLVSPPELRLPKELIDDFMSRARAHRGHHLKESQFIQLYNDLEDDLLSKTDVLYATRIQRERFDGQDKTESSLSKSQMKSQFFDASYNYRLTADTLSKAAKQNMILMHPLPRVGEIDPEVDLDQRAAYFRQMKYGLYVRMALLALVLG